MSMHKNERWSLSVLFGFSLISLSSCTMTIDANELYDDLGGPFSNPDLANPGEGSLCVTPTGASFGPAGGRITVDPRPNPSYAGSGLFVPPGALNGVAILEITCGQDLIFDRQLAVDDAKAGVAGPEHPVLFASA
jgi:hypothetical protein